MGCVPDDELGSNALKLWRSLEAPATNGHVSRPLGCDVLTRLPRRDCCPVSTLSWSGFARADSTTEVVLGPRPPITAGTGYLLNQRGVAGPNLADVRPWRLPAARSRSSTSSTASSILT